MSDPEQIDLNSPTSLQEVGKKEPNPIDLLPEQLGFIETDELMSLQRLWIEAADDETYRDAVTQYHEHAQDLVDQQNGASRTKAQIGLIIQMALVRRDLGKMDLYIEDIEDAMVYAHQERLDNVASILETELTPTSERIAHACREVLSGEDTQELADMPLDEALGYAFSLLIEAGEDPEEFLKERKILDKP